MTKRSQETSLVAKLRAIAIGETIYLDDAREGGRKLAAEVHAAIGRSDVLAGRNFSTATMVAVQTQPVGARAILAVTRQEDKADEIW